MPQYPVPQFIESEGKIVSFLTYRQFFLLVAGGAICFALFFFTPFIVFLIGSLFSVIFFLAIAFYKINNITLPVFFMQAMGFVLGSKNYTWKKKEMAYPLKLHTDNKTLKSLPIETPPMRLQSKPSKLKNIQKMVDTRK